MKRIISLLVGVGFAGFLLSQGITQEVPIGSVKGQIVPRNEILPLKGRTVVLRPYSPWDETPRFIARKKWRTTCAADGTFEVKGLPTGLYEAEVFFEYHRLESAIFEVEEGKRTPAKLFLDREAPSLSINTSQRVSTPDEEPEIEAYGFIPDRELQVDIRKIDAGQIVVKGGIRDLLSPVLSSTRALSAADLKGIATPVKSFKFPIAKKSEGDFRSSLPIGKLAPGYYWVRCGSKELHTDTIVNVSDIALITKSENRHALCYVVNLQSGEPVPGATIQAWELNALVTKGVTDQQGLLKVDLPLSGESNLGVIATKGSSMAVTTFWRATPTREDYIITGYCARPVYRPGDTVQYRGVIRRAEGDDRSVRGGAPVEVEVKDPEGEVVYTDRLNLSAHGTFSGEFPTSREGAPGGYQIVCRTMGVTLNSLEAQVASYRKPEYSVSVRPEGGPFVMGDKLAMLVTCQYYFGGPVVGAKVTGLVMRGPAYSFTDENGEEIQDGSGGEFVGNVEGTTDAAGRAILAISTRLESDKRVPDTDYFYTMTASVADDANHYFEGSGKAMVARGATDLRLDLGQYMARKGDRIKATVKTLDAFKSGTPLAGQTVTIEYGNEVWDDQVSNFSAKGSTTTQTGANGEATIEIPVTEGGYMDFRAKSVDARGGTVTARASLYIEGGAVENSPPVATLSLKLDRHHYQAGDEARVLVQANSPGGTALITLQTDTIRWIRTVKLNAESTIVPIPVTKDDAPNVYVSAVYVREKTMSEDTRRLVVSRDDRQLQVNVSSDQPTYLPGGKVQLKVQTRNQAGKPTPAEVSLAVVDESIYAIRADQTNLYQELNPDRYNSVSTNNSFPEIYLDGGDKGSSMIPVRKKFLDTAAWLPSVVTGVDGTATVSVTLPDNLTQWRVTAIGVSDTGMAGQTTSSFRAKKPLMVRALVPQYMVQGDEQEMAVSVTNDTGKDADVRLETDIKFCAAEGDRNPKLRIASGATESVVFRLKPEYAAKATVTAKVWTDAKTNDGVEQSFEIHPLGRNRISVGVATTSTNATMNFSREAETDPEQSELAVHLSPSLAGGLLSTIDSLVDFPYGCVEQTMSRFMPALVVADALPRLGLQRPELAARIPRVAADSMARLANMQQGDGGWGWWSNDRSDPEMTALVLDGLARAKAVGYPVKGIKLKAALDWAQKRVATPEASDSVRARVYLAYAIQKHGRRAKGLDRVDLGQASNSELAIAALAYHLAGMEGPAAGAMDRLSRYHEGDITAVTWPSGEYEFGSETTAWCLAAFLAVRPNDPIVPRIVRGILSQRRGDQWSSTRDSSYVITSVMQYLIQSKELVAPSSVTVSINGTAVKTVELSPSHLKGETVMIPMAGLKQGPFQVSVSVSGGGTCYATAEYRQLAVPSSIKDALAPDSTLAGIRIRRAYYRLEPRKLEDGTTRLLPSEKPVTDFKSGELIRVELTAESDSTHEFVLLEDPVPANCRVMERTEPEEEWTNFWSQTELRDDRIAFFSRRLSSGTQKFTYTMRAESPGAGTGLPTRIGNMYDPTHFAETGSIRVGVAK